MTSLSHRLLQLLMSNPPAAVFQQALLDLSSSTNETSDEDRSAVQLAIQLRGKFDKYEDTVEELTRLYETVGDLLIIRDYDAVIQAVVKHGRTLLRCDIAYLMLVNSHSKDISMRAAAGSVTSEFMKIRFPWGTGLAGTVLLTAAPCWSDDYFEDHRFVHVVDDAVKEEEIKAILGVPLRAGDHVIGALLAAHRTPHNFSLDEVSLLALLSANAAVALQNASDAESAKESTKRLKQARRDLKIQMQTLQRADSVHGELARLAASGATITEVCESVANATHGCVLLASPEGATLAFAKPPAPATADRTHLFNIEFDDVLPLELLRRALPSQAGVSHIETGEGSWSGRHFVFSPVYVDHDLLGVLFDVIDQVDQHWLVPRVLDRAATVIALMAMKQRSQDETENRLRGELVSELIRGAVPDVNNVVRRARLLGVDLSGPCIVLAARPTAKPVGPTFYAAMNLVVRDLRGLQCRVGEVVAAIVPEQDADAIASRVSERLSEDPNHFQAVIGASGPTSDLSQLSSTYAQALRCCQVMHIMGRGGEWATPEQLGIYALLLADSSQSYLDSFIEQQIGPLKKYDLDRNTDLVDSLAVYFDNDCSVSRAAASLYIHPNTLYQRLTRIEQLLGEDWNTGDRHLQLRLAVKFMKVLGKLQ